MKWFLRFLPFKIRGKREINKAKFQDNIVLIAGGIQAAR
jgi:hypothetical protein